MDEKELRKLRRQDLLQLLLLQSRETTKLQNELMTLEDAHIKVQDSRSKLIERLDEKDAQLERLTEKLGEKDATIGRLKERLDEKDAQIAHLTARLDEKDTQRKRLIDKLDDKDAQLDRLKRRLDEKDAQIKQLKDAPIRLSDAGGGSGEITIGSLLSVVKDSLSGQLRPDEAKSVPEEPKQPEPEDPEPQQEKADPISPAEQPELQPGPETP